MRKIAFYGKGGIGKSILTSSIAAAMAGMDKRVMQIGYDPKADSTLSLRAGQELTPVMDVLQAYGGLCPSLDAISVKGYRGIVCVEAGGPTPGSDCAGRGIIKTFDTLDDFNAFQVYAPEYVFFDVLGDVVCGGFAVPIRQGYADELVIVTPGTKMALYAAANIKKALDNSSRISASGRNQLQYKTVRPGKGYYESVCNHSNFISVYLLPDDYVSTEDNSLYVYYNAVRSVTGGRRFPSVSTVIYFVGSLRMV